MSATGNQPQPQPHTDHPPSGTALILLGDEVTVSCVCHVHSDGTQPTISMVSLLPEVD